MTSQHKEGLTKAKPKSFAPTARKTRPTRGTSTPTVRKPSPATTTSSSPTSDDDEFLAHLQEQEADRRAQRAQSPDARAQRARELIQSILDSGLHHVLLLAQDPSIEATFNALLPIRQCMRRLNYAIRDTDLDNSLLSQVPSIKTTPAWPRATGSGLNENASIATQEWLRPTGSGPSEKRPRATSVSGSDLRLV